MNTKMHHSEERHEFKIHPAIIYSLITAQASGVEKAILELVMNSVDAQATRIDVTLNQERFEVRDNGVGFKDMSAVEECFGILGLPHEDGDAYYGKFRLGRLQSFGYAKTEWHTKNIKMLVDLNVDKNVESYGYETKEVDEYYQGCIVKGEFYEYMEHCNPNVIIDLSICKSPYSVENAVIALALSVKYLPVDIYINGVRANKHASEDIAYHTSKEADFYLKEISHSDDVGVYEIQVYNKGVFAYSITSSSLFGDIVARKTLNLNMARNEPKGSCKVARAISLKMSNLSYMVIAKLQETPVKTVTPEQQKFVENFWATLFGINGAKFTDVGGLLYALSSKWFKAPCDTEEGYFDLGWACSSYAYNSINRNHSSGPVLKFYSRDYVVDKIAYASQLDTLGMDMGYIPYEMMPSQDVIKYLCGQELIFDINQFSELSDYSSLFDKNLIVLSVPSDASVLDGYQKVYEYLSKICLWLKIAHDYYVSYKVRDPEYAKIHSDFRRMTEFTNHSFIGFGEFESLGLERADYEQGTNAFRKATRKRAVENVNKVFKDLETLQTFKLPSSELDYAYCEHISKRIEYEDTLPLTKFQSLALGEIKWIMSRLDLKLTNKWNESKGLVDDAYMGECRTLYLADLSPNVLACTDSYNYILLNYSHFCEMLKENKYEQLVYLIMHEVAHCSVEQSHIHGESFYRGFQYLLNSMRPCIGQMELTLKDWTLNKSNFRSKKAFDAFGASKQNVEYFLKMHMVQYEGRF